MITLKINATSFNDEQTSTHENDRDAFDALHEHIAYLIDAHVRDEMHDANECDITLKIHLRNVDNDIKHNTQMIVTHDCEYENIINVDEINPDYIVARYD